MNAMIRTFFLGLAGLMMFGTSAQAMGDRPEKPVEIEAEEQLAVEEAREVPGPEEIKEIQPSIPEVPKPLKEEVGGVEKLKVDDIEHRRAGGQLTQMEADLEKDNLGREANAKF